MVYTCYIMCSVYSICEVYTWVFHTIYKTYIHTIYKNNILQYITLYYKKSIYLNDIKK